MEKITHCDKKNSGFLFQTQNDESKNKLNSIVKFENNNNVNNNNT